MGFLSKLFGQKQNDKSKPYTDIQKHPAAVTERPGLEFYEKVIDNIVVSDTLRNDLKVQLKKSFEDPKSFFDENNEFILSDRGLTYPKAALLTPKFVLVDTLRDNRQMAEVDWKEEEIEIRFAVNEIAKAKKYDFTLANDNQYKETDTFKVIKLIDEGELRPAGYSLKILDINSDSYVFTIVPLDKDQEVEKMFATLK